MPTALELAARYRGRGWYPVPVPHRQKKPVLTGWQKLRLDAADLADHFNGHAQNIGILLSASGLADADLDSPEARRLAPHFLPPTPARFGRPGKPESHWLYAGADATYCKLTDPQDGACLVELRAGDGLQTVFPGSTHVSGEPITWSAEGEPAKINGADLGRAAHRLAAAALLARHYPAEGSRHDLCLALAGCLLRTGMDLAAATDFLRAVAETAGDEEAEQRTANVRTTASRLAADRNATGWPTLATLLGQPVADKLRAWLLPPDAPAAPAPVEAPWQPALLIAEDEQAQSATGTWLDEYIAYCQARTDAPLVYHEAVGLVALATVVGRRACLRLSTGTVYPALWTLLLGESSIDRKSTSLDLGRELVALVDADLLAPDDFTPQRFIAILAEHSGRPLLFHRDEFSGFLEGLSKLDYMSGLKECLCNVYDGRAVRREKMKQKGSDESAWRFECPEPYLAVAAGTTQDRFAETARPGDLHSGFLPRFALVVPPDEPREWQPIGELDERILAARDALAQRLAALARGEVRLSIAPEALRRFNRYVHDLEDEARAAPNRSLVGIVGARISWMALKIAMLLAVADGSQRVGLPHLYRGMTVAEGWHGANLRLLGNLAPSYFERKAGAVVDLLRRHGSKGLSRSAVMNALRLSKREMDDVQATLVERGEVRLEARQTATRGGVWLVAAGNVLNLLNVLHGHVSPASGGSGAPKGPQPAGATERRQHALAEDSEHSEDSPVGPMNVLWEPRGEEWQEVPPDDDASRYVLVNGLEIRRELDGRRFARWAPEPAEPRAAEEEDA